jgi:hypothetical protein
MEVAPSTISKERVMQLSGARNVVLSKLILCCAVIAAVRGQALGDEVRQAVGAEKISVLSEISSASRANYEMLRTWSGSYSYRKTDRIPSKTFATFANQVGLNSGLEGNTTEAVLQATGGQIKFRRNMADIRLFLEVKDDGPVKFSGALTGAVFLPTGATPVARHERVLITSDEIIAYMPDLNFRGEVVGELPGGTIVDAATGVTRTPRRRLNGPVWALDTNPWLGQYFDPANLFGDDRPTWELLDEYVRNLRGAFGADHANAIDAALRVEIQTVERNGEKLFVITTMPPMTRRKRVFAASAGGNLLESIQYNQKADPTIEETPIVQQMNWEYQSVDNVFVPERVRLKRYAPGSQEVVQEIEYQRKSVEVNRAIPNSELTIDSLEVP